MKSKIILTAEAELQDELLRKEFIKLQTKIDTLNDRTKAHTLQIKELEKFVKGREYEINK